MDCPICNYPLQEINTIVFGLLYKCRNMSCFSKRYGNTARDMSELEEIGELLRKNGV